MASDLIVAMIHGVGPTRAGYSLPFQAGVRKRLERRGFDAARVHFEEIRWAGLLEGKHQELLHRMENPRRLRHRAMRKFVIAAVGESGAYREVGTSGHALYDEIHQTIRDQLALAEKTAGDVPLVLVGHSLGSVIMSDHVWDEQAGHGRGSSDLQRCQSLAGVVTLGSPLPLYTLAHRRVQAIEFPGAGLDERLRRAARWINLFDPDDVLGWPLRPTAEPYTRTVAEDIRLNVGSFLTSWNPLSHLGYWKDASVHRVVAPFLAELLDAIRNPGLDESRSGSRSARWMRSLRTRVRGGQGATQVPHA